MVMFLPGSRRDGAELRGRTRRRDRGRLGLLLLGPPVLLLLLLGPRGWDCISGRGRRARRALGARRGAGGRPALPAAPPARRSLGKERRGRTPPPAPLLQAGQGHPGPKTAPLAGPGETIRCLCCNSNRGRHVLSPALNQLVVL